MKSDNRTIGLSKDKRKWAFCGQGHRPKVRSDIVRTNLAVVKREIV